MATKATTTRSYATRDSATAALRRLGVPKEKYDEFITFQAGDTFEAGGVFETNLSAAEQYLLDTGTAPNDKHPAGKAWPFSQPKGKAAAPAKQLTEAHAAAFDKSAKAPSKPKADEPIRRTVKAANTAPLRATTKKVPAKGTSVSSIMRAMILDGKTNEEVWKHCQKKFQLDEKKKSYPAWYRAQLRKQGEKV